MFYGEWGENVAKLNRHIPLEADVVSLPGHSAAGEDTGRTGTNSLLTGNRNRL